MSASPWLLSFCRGYPLFCRWQSGRIRKGFFLEEQRVAFPGKDLLVNQSQRLDSSWNVPKQTRDLGDAAFHAAYRSAAEWILTHEQACVYVLFVVCHPHAMPPHHTTPHHATSCHAMPCHDMPCSRSHMPCHAMP
mgnify:CR=1 FL=1